MEKAKRIPYNGCIARKNRFYDQIIANNNQIMNKEVKNKVRYTMYKSIEKHHMSCVKTQFMNDAYTPINIITLLLLTTLISVLFKSMKGIKMSSE